MNQSCIWTHGIRDADLWTDAQVDGPVVFLESTVIAQGLPWPENLQTALAMEEAIRTTGATPATIALLDGSVRVGLSRVELERIARSALASGTAAEDLSDQPTGGRDAPFAKANRRDLAAVISRAGNAATTVSATLWLAERSGLWPCVLATGGLGGVHRGAGESFDVSTDLDELARADGCVVVCSGFKSILDLPATLEALETRGVLVVGYRTDELPGFTTRSSGLALEHRVDSPQQAAALVRAHQRLRVPGAVVLANPVPEEESIPHEVAERALERALEDARRLRVRAKAITPFLLESIRAATAGASLRANCALLVANARLAAEVAVAVTGQTTSRTDSGA
jgi:pseudouridine-5'-phosphate glycosidase